ncbi:MAG TPA: sigma factor-like helix-turn-helix DNA-binding protein [Candidatus Cryosericum sp.]|nr:sigma factor-like helix-turn-helix DNA-binding protein [Candidatus Cryosericum sp.]
MNRLVELGQLLDWYGAFLTQRQRSLVRQYAFEDCSLGEIAEREGISRQAVRDAITTAETELRGMEQKLGLIEKNERSRALLAELIATPLSERQRKLAEELLELSSNEEEA